MIKIQEYLGIPVLFATFFLGLDSNSSQICKNLFTQRNEIESIFSGSNLSVVRITLKADFIGALNLKKNENPDDSIFVDAEIIDNNTLQRFKARIKARGDSVLNDDGATFPKIRVEINDEEKIKGSLFEGQRKFRINTHISDKTSEGTTKNGRATGGNATIREGVVYKIADLLGLVAPQTQFAEITYIDSAKNKVQKARALLIETDKKTAKRFESEPITNLDSIETQQRTIVSPKDAALFMVFHKMIGNEDFDLFMYESKMMTNHNNPPLWNTFLIKTPDGQFKPVVYDFDLALAVTGRDFSTGRELNALFELNDLSRGSFYMRMAKLKQKLKQEDILSAVRTIKAKKQAIYDLIENSPGDRIQVKDVVLRQIKLFMAFADSSLENKVIAAENVNFFSKPDARSKQKTRISGIDNKPFVLRPGTPVKIFGESGKFLLVAIMDLHGDLAEGQSVVGYIKKNTPIADFLPEELLGWLDERDM